MDTITGRTKTGVVTSTQMEKTIVVTVATYKRHSKYKKRYKDSTKFYAHDENGIAHVGDTVTIKETRPMSRLKRWIIIEDSISKK